jgi:hypothetical protein
MSKLANEAKSRQSVRSSSPDNVVAVVPKNAIDFQRRCMVATRTEGLLALASKTLLGTTRILLEWFL